MFGLGAKLNEGCVLTRDREAFVSRELSKAPLVQANIDYTAEADDGDIMWSRKRRAVAERFFKKNKDLLATSAQIWDLLSIEPIFNEVLDISHGEKCRKSPFFSRLPSIGQ